MTLPVIGAALRVDELPQFRDWIMDKNRDVELQSFMAADLLNSADWQPMVDQAKASLAGHSGRLGLHGPFQGLSFSNPDPEIRQIVKKRMTQGLDVAEALGAQFMVIHSPYTTWDWHNMDRDAVTRARILDFAHDCLDEAVARAANQGCTLVLENIEDIDPEDRKLMVQSFDSAAFKLSIDTGHAQYAHGATGARPVDFFVRSAGAMLGHVHLQDADGFADRHWALGEGTIRWHEVFRALSDISADPVLVLELRDKAGILPSLRWLEEAGLAQ